MTRIKIKDLPRDMKIDQTEMKRIVGGKMDYRKKYPSRSRLLVDSDFDVIVKPEWWDFFY